MQVASRGGIVVGPPHSGGGVPFALKGTHNNIEEEGFEVNIPEEILYNSAIYTITATNAQALDKILKLAGLSLSDKVTDVRAGDIVICVRSAWDDEVRTFTGTIEQILHEINTSKGCKPIIEPIAKKGGKLKDTQIEDPNSERWQKKKQHLQELSNNIHRLRMNVSRDIESDDEKLALTALAIALMDKTAERIGNDDSARNGHFGVTSFRKKHLNIVGNKVHLDYVGKRGMKHEKSFSDERIAKALKKAIKHSPGKFIFQTSDGFRIKADKVNRYLESFNITAKDIRGYLANKWMIDKFKKEISFLGKSEATSQKQRKKIFNQSLRKTAGEVGHGSGTLKKHYLIPELSSEFIEHGNIIDLKNLGYYIEGGTLGDKVRSLETEKHFNNVSKVLEIVDKQTEELNNKAAQTDGGIYEIFNSFPIKTIDWKDIVATQSYLDPLKIKNLESIRDIYSIPLPWLVEYEGKFYINDGHHRIAEMHKRNLPIKAHVHEINPMHDHRKDGFAGQKIKTNFVKNNEMIKKETEVFFPEKKNTMMEQYSGTKKPKYEIGQTVFMAYNHRAISGVIDSVETDHNKSFGYKHVYSFRKFNNPSNIRIDINSFYECEVYPSMHELRKNVKHYKAMLSEDEMFGGGGGIKLQIVKPGEKGYEYRVFLNKESADALALRISGHVKYYEMVPGWGKVDTWKVIEGKNINKKQEGGPTDEPALSESEVIIDDENPMQEEIDEQFENLDDDIDDTEALEVPNQGNAEDYQQDISSAPSGEDCKCLFVFLEKEDPELIEQLMTEDINSTPALREKFNEAHKAWRGGKLK